MIYTPVSACGQGQTSEWRKSFEWFRILGIPKEKHVLLWHRTFNSESTSFFFCFFFLRNHIITTSSLEQKQHLHHKTPMRHSLHSRSVWRPSACGWQSHLSWLSTSPRPLPPRQRTVTAYVTCQVLNWTQLSLICSLFSRLNDSVLL